MSYSFSDFLGDFRGLAETSADIYAQRQQIKSTQRQESSAQLLATAAAKQPGPAPAAVHLGTWQLVALGVSVAALAVAAVLLARG